MSRSTLPRKPRNSDVNPAKVHVHAPRPEVIRAGGLHGIEATGKTYGIREITPAVAVAQRPHCNSTMPNGNPCPGLYAAPARPGASDASRLPSRTCFVK